MLPRAALFLACAASLSCERTSLAREKPVPADPQRPFVAIWMEDDGYGPPRAPSSGADTADAASGPAAPCLRVAIWNDGRVLFARNPKKWSNDLREGKILPEQIARLKTELAATGVFTMNNATYLVPDAGFLCMMLDIDGQTQILRWDENGNPNYGINIDPKPRHLKFKEVWASVNRLAIAARPVNSERFTGTFKPAASWSLRPAIQSR